jgi:hypothetical protein
MGIKQLGDYVDEGELTPRFVKTVIAITAAFLVIGGIFTYYITFVVLGF